MPNGGCVAALRPVTCRMFNISVRVVHIWFQTSYSVFSTSKRLPNTYNLLPKVTWLIGSALEGPGVNRAYRF